MAFNAEYAEVYILAITLVTITATTLLFLGGRIQVQADVARERAPPAY